MIGFEIRKRARAVSAETVAAFKGLPVANVSDCMMRLTAAGPTLRPMHKGGYLAGPALTVKTRPGDNLMIHKAISMAVPGDVIVVDAGGELTHALFGEIMTAAAKMRGVAGLVFNGAIRDCEEIGAGDYPIYAAGVTHRGPYKDGPGEINVPIAFGGMVIAPGDLIIGDADGVHCVPFEQTAEVLVATHKKMAQEKKSLEDIAAGKQNIAWVDETLRRLGVNPDPQ